MKKNLAKKIVLGLLTGAVLMSSSVAWAAAVGFVAGDIGGDGCASTATGEWSVTVGHGNVAKGVGSIAIGHSSFATGNNSIVIGSNDSGMYSSDGDKGVNFDNVGYDNCIVIGSNSHAGSGNSVALGNGSKVSGTGSVALGYGSYVGLGVENVVSVGSGGSNYISAENAPATRSIINVTDVAEADRIAKDSNGKYIYGSYVVNVNTLNEALASVQQQSVDLNNYYTKSEADGKFVKIENDKISNAGNITFDVGDETNVVTISATGLTVGDTSTHIDGKGVYVGAHNFNNAKAAMNDNGEIKGVNGTFSGNVTAKEVTVTKFYIDKGNGSTIDVENELSKKANSADVYKKTETYSQTEVDSKVDALQQVDQDLQSQIDNIGGGAISGINQRLDKTNAKINKVGAGAAALAALHPLEYDPDDKLTFSAGMGNYAGENAAALGAFYRPNEKFMVSLGGTMGNGENMVNLGLSIGLDKPNGYAKLSKRELIQKVNAMEAKYEAVEAEKEAMKAEMAEMKAMLQAILAKK